MQPAPGAALEVIEAQFLFQLLVALLDRPALVGEPHQPGGQVGEVVFEAAVPESFDTAASERPRAAASECHAGTPAPAPRWLGPWARRPGAAAPSSNAQVLAATGPAMPPSRAVAWPNSARAHAGAAGRRSIGSAWPPLQPARRQRCPALGPHRVRLSFPTPQAGERVQVEEALKRQPVMHRILQAGIAEVVPQLQTMQAQQQRDFRQGPAPAGGLIVRCHDLGERGPWHHPVHLVEKAVRPRALRQASQRKKRRLLAHVQCYP